jgi:hypothetical protein
MSNPKRRDQTVRLKSTSNGKVVTAKVVQHDSVQGYLAIRPDDEWMWFKPKDWEEIE